MGYLSCDNLPSLVTTHSMDLLNIVGLPGIGKTSLLLEAKDRLLAMVPAPLVILVNMAEPPLICDPRDKFLRQVETKLFGRVSTALPLDVRASAVVEAVNNQNLYLMVDSTETYQKDREFWSWLEDQILIHLMAEEMARLVFTGRTPAPLMTWPVRRRIKLIKVPSFNPGDPTFVQAIENGMLCDPDLHRPNLRYPNLAGNLAGLSYGHPHLASRLNYYTDNCYNGEPWDVFEQTLYDQVIKDFIETRLLSTLDPYWAEAIWWLCILDSFDLQVLPKYIRRVAPHLASRVQTVDPIIKGLSDLRQSGLAEQDKSDHFIIKVVQDIMVRYLIVRDRANYCRGCQAAMDTLHELAVESAPENVQELETQAKQYETRFNQYR